MKPVEYSVITTDFSMTESPKRTTSQAVGVVYVAKCPSVTGSMQTHGVSYDVDDELVDPLTDDAYAFNFTQRRVAPVVCIVDYHSLHAEGRAERLGACARVVRGFRELAAGAMLSTADLFVPYNESYPHGKIEAELQQHLSWLHNLQLGEPSVPVPPIRITESYRVFPPEWDVDDEFLALDDASFLFGEELR